MSAHVCACAHALPVPSQQKQEQHSRKQEERKRALTTAWRQQEAKGIEQGKKPFFLKKGTIT